MSVSSKRQVLGWVRDYLSDNAFIANALSKILGGTVTAGSTEPAYAGTQRISFTPALTGATLHGIDPWSDDDYGFELTVDGGVAQDIVITVDPVDIDGLVADINTKITGASCALVSGNIVFTSDTVNAESSIAVTNTVAGLVTALFPALPGYDAIVGAVAGGDEVSVPGVNFDNPIGLTLDTFDDEADAVAAGLSSGALYKTPTGAVRIKL